MKLRSCSSSLVYDSVERREQLRELLMILLTAGLGYSSCGAVDHKCVFRCNNHCISLDLSAKNYVNKDMEVYARGFGRDF